MIDLAGRAALVTGGSRGVGRATALLLARAGADVAITCRSRVADAEETAAAIRTEGRRAVVLTGDLRDAATAERIVGAAAGELGHLDLVVANAGVWPAKVGPAGGAG